MTRKADFSEIFSLLKKKLQPIRIENNNFYRKTSMISTNRNDFFKVFEQESRQVKVHRYVNFEMFSIKKYVNFTFKENYNAN